MADPAKVKELTATVERLKKSLDAHHSKHSAAVENMSGELSQLNKSVRAIQETEDKVASRFFDREVEWTITDYKKKVAQMTQGQNIWSPKFKAVGLEAVQLEFFPKGRETVSESGFCSLYLWCPSGPRPTRIKYQLWVGKFRRTPDQDEYVGRVGHGHKNFCLLAPQVDEETDSLRLGVIFHEVVTDADISCQGLRLLSLTAGDMVARELDIFRNAQVEKVVWKIKKATQALKLMPRGASMWSPPFSAAGIPQIFFEFYPNGSLNTTKEGHCAFYLRCPVGVSITITLFVGLSRRGPIKTTFESLMGKGLPDFCSVEEQVSMEDTLEIGIMIKSQTEPKYVMETV